MEIPSSGTTKIALYTIRWHHQVTSSGDIIRVPSMNQSSATLTWYMSKAGSGYVILGTITTQLPRATAGANNDTKASSGSSCGQIIPTTPTGSCTFIVAPHSSVSCKQHHERLDSGLYQTLAFHKVIKIFDFPKKFLPFRGHDDILRTLSFVSLTFHNFFCTR